MSAPVVSVIIPTRNRAASLAGALASLAALDLPSDFHEVLLVDNGSTDETPSVLAAIAESYPRCPLRGVVEPEPGLLAGRHRGAREARAPLLVFIDDDVEVAPTWLRGIVDAFTDPTVHLVGGPSLPRYEVPPPPWLEWLWTRNGARAVCGDLSLLDFGNQAREIDPAWIWGLNFSIRKETLAALGGFHPDCLPRHLQRYQGDGETGLALKAKTRGLRAMYAPGALVHHRIPAARLTLAALEERHYYQGVCNSYAEIRAAGGVPPGPDWKSTARGLRRLLRSAGGPRNRLLARLERAREAGRRFHRQEVRRDPALLAWVLKDDYWDYRLPGPVSGRPRPA